jgi:hypothetical protein
MTRICGTDQEKGRMTSTIHVDMLMSRRHSGLFLESCFSCFGYFPPCSLAVRFAHPKPTMGAVLSFCRSTKPIGVVLAQKDSASRGSRTTRWNYGHSRLAQLVHVDRHEDERFPHLGEALVLEDDQFPHLYG